MYLHGLNEGMHIHWEDFLQVLLDIDIRAPTVPTILDRDLLGVAYYVSTAYLVRMLALCVTDM
jgi:hypothetical protein